MTLADNRPVNRQVSTPSEKDLFSWFKERSLRTKAIALGVMLGVLPVIAIGVAATTIASRSFTDKIVQVEESKAVTVADKLNLFMRERYTDIQHIAALDVLTTSAPNAATANKQAALQEFLDASNGVYQTIVYVDLEGNIMARTRDVPSVNLKDQVWFQEVVRTNRPYLSQPAISKVNGAFSVFTAAPIKDKATGKTIGVVRTQMPVTELTKLFGQNENLLEQYYLVNTAGEVFVGPGDQSKYAIPVTGAGQRVKSNDREFATVTAQKLFPQYQQLKASNRTEAVFTDKQLLVYNPVREIENLPPLNWDVLAAIDQSTALAPQQQLLQALALGLFVAIAIVAVIAYLLANRATRPLISAANAVEKIGQGDLGVRLPFSGKDELATLGSNINTMAAQLQRSLELQEFETAQERLLTLAKGSGVVRSPDLPGVFDEVLDNARKLLDLDRIVIYTFDQEMGGVISEALRSGLPSARRLDVKDNCIPPQTREAYSQGRIVVARDITEAGFGLDHLKLLERLRVKASLTVPIVNGDQLFGLLIAHHCSSTYDWQETETNLLPRLAYELGLTVYRVELLERTIALADEQRQLKERLQQRALELLQEVDPISQGDLTIRARVTPDEIGTLADSYNAIVTSLQKIVSQVKATATQVTTNASGNEELILKLAQEATYQTEEVATALTQIEQMANAIRTVADNAKAAEVTVERATQTVKLGDRAMNRTVEGFQAIQKTVTEAAEKVKRLSESSQKISTVVDLINAFAAQTNMLALNASIEASRAGEQGRGFAVVAEEVRTLAQQSAEAANEIKKLVAGIQMETDEVTIAMTAGTEQVDVGTRLVDETRLSLNQITAASDEVVRLVNAISQAALEQTRASETVSRTMKGVATIADQNSTEANQVALSIAQLRQIAQNLQESVEQFKLS
jgi:methyl-accepting chemotaxis protein